MADSDLRSERLILRAPASDDLPWILEAINTSAMMRHLGGAVRSEAEIAQDLDSDIAAFSSPDGHQKWTAWLRQTNARVGRCGLFHIRSEAAPAALRGQREIGWMFAERYWGKGYATEAARAVLAYAFGPRAIPNVFAQTSDSNAASTRMMARLGFARRPEFDYVDPDYPAADNPTTVWSLDAKEQQRDG